MKDNSFSESKGKALHISNEERAKHDIFVRAELDRQLQNSEKGNKKTQPFMQKGYTGQKI